MYVQRHIKVRVYKPVKFLQTPFILRNILSSISIWGNLTGYGNGACLHFINKIFCTKINKNMQNIYKSFFFLLCPVQLFRRHLITSLSSGQGYLCLEWGQDYVIILGLVLSCKLFGPPHDWSRSVCTSHIVTMLKCPEANGPLPTHFSWPQSP